jgi:hypothetical protein
VACHESDSESPQDVVGLFNIACEFIVAMGKAWTVKYILARIVIQEFTK